MKVLVATCLFVSSFCVLFAESTGPCKPGNEPVENIECFPDCPAEEIWCCTPVGDGSAVSCTDGESWWCIGNCG